MDTMIQPHRPVIIILLTAVLVLTVSGCSRTDRTACRSTVSGTLQDSADIARTWIRLSRLGAHDSLIRMTVPFFQQALEDGDSVSASWAAAFIAQSSLLDNNIDSAEKYISFLERTETGNLPPGLQGTIYNTLGIHSVMTRLDYPKAIEYLTKSYRITLEHGHIGNQIIQLANIVNLFYIRSDIKGMKFAREVLKTASSPDASPYHRYISDISMAKMQYVAGHTDSAWHYIALAESNAGQDSWPSVQAATDLLKADLCRSESAVRQADSLYREALRSSGHTDIGTTVSIYLHYGDFAAETGLTDKADSLYRQGVFLSERHDNLEFRRELLLRLTDLCHARGNEAEAMKFYWQYRDITDRVAANRTERDFNNLLISYSEMEHEVEMQGKEIAVLKANRRTLITAFTAAILILVILLLWLRYRKQQEMYRKLVEQYQSHLRQTAKSKTANDNSQDRSLWDRLETAMQEQKVFRQKDMTLDRAAAMLGTNRTYLSKAVNTFSDCDFSTYVNKYRIRESISIMQECGKQTAFKEIADRVGYNSLQAYYNAFQKETGLSPGKYREQILRIQKTS